MAETGISISDDPVEQLWPAIEAVFKSWNNARAIKYREVNNISDDWGTAVNIQSMVFGNLGDNCGTGVCFSRNPSTGEAGVFGEYLFNAQGEDVVAGIRTPAPLNENSKNLNDDSIYYLNVGTGKDIKIKKLANIIATALNYKGEIVWDTSKPDGTPKKQLDISKIKNLGWKPKIELIEGITDTARSYFSKI